MFGIDEVIAEKEEHLSKLYRLQLSFGAADVAGYFPEVIAQKMAEIDSLEKKKRKMVYAGMGKDSGE